MMVKVLAASLGCIGYLVWRQTSRKRIPQRMSIMTRCVQRERPFCSQRPDEFSIISYNILADCYCLNGYNASAYAYVHPQFLDWEYRWPQLKEELAEFKADVICLQEVEVVRWDEFSEYMQDLGYHPLLQDRGKNGSQVATAIFFKTTKFEVVWQQNRSRTMLAALKWRSHPAGESQVTWFINVHLEGSHYRPNDRVSQMKSALAALQKQQLAEGADVSTSSVVVLGDFNSGPQGAVCDLLYRGRLEAGYTEASLPEVPVTVHTVAHPYALQDAYAHANGAVRYTRKVPGVEQKIDFIWCSREMGVSGVLQPVRFQDQLLIARCNLPNRLYPSDHLPIGAILRQTPPDPPRTSLSPPEQAELM